MSNYISPFTSPFRTAFDSPYSPGLGGAVAVPAGFGWTPPINVYKQGSTYSTDYDPTPFLVEGDPGVTTYYVDSVTGSAGNPGTAALPKNSLVAISGGRVGKLLIKARGTFYVSYTGAVQTGHDELVLEAWGGAECVITNEEEPSNRLVWADETGGVWSTTPPFAGWNGIAPYKGTDPETLVKYPLASSLANCQATPGTYWRVTSPSIIHYVHTLDGSSPATNHTVYRAGGSAQAYAAGGRAFNQRLGFYGIDFRGGVAAFEVTGDSAYNKRIDLVNCLFRHGSTKAACAASGQTMMVQYGCIAGPSDFDGFSCSTATGAAGGNVPKSIEINCIGRNNGKFSGANQGSTTHFGGNTVRVNCQYYNNQHDQVADVGDGTRSWMLGCVMGPQGAVGPHGFQLNNGATDAQAWMDGCTFVGCTYDVGVATATSTLHYRNMPAPNIDPTQFGIVTTY